MRPIAKTALTGLAVVLLAGVAVFFTALPQYAQATMNASRAHPPYSVSKEALALHKELFVADLHADSLLWRRDLSQRSSVGHVDVPRLAEANVGLQAFTVVTHAPMGQNYAHNTGDSDIVTLLVIAQRWPFATWTSRLARARYEAEKLRGFEEASGHQLMIIRTQQDLRYLQERRRAEPELVGGFLGLEGGQALEGDLKNVDVLFDEGFRMMAPVHFYDNELGGSAHGAQKGGLTDFGREVIRKQEALGLLVDVAHGSPALIDDVVAMTTRPLVMSHGGVRGTCDNNRNLTDAHVDAIARSGGVIGIGLWETAVCGTDARATARAMKYVADRVGVEHVALGSDYDGTVKAPFDVTGLPLVTEALMAEGFTREEIALIMGGNTARLLAQTLPKE